MLLEQELVYGGFIAWSLLILIMLVIVVRQNGKISALQTKIEVFQIHSERLERGIRDDLNNHRLEICELLRQNREELGGAIERQNQGLNTSREQSRQLVEEKLTAFQLEHRNQSESLRSLVDDKLQSAQQDAGLGRAELAVNLKQFGDQITGQLQQLMQRNTESQELLRQAVETKLLHIQADNNQKLELMRQTVDEKLHNTLEQRLGESFKLVSERLEQVHNGLGEMRTLASGVGDLKKVLANVKIRGTWGEVQLENLLAQVLSPDQYAKNISTRPNSNERVEFAIKLPGRDEDGSVVWLPIDSKFPLEDYQRLVDAQESVDLPIIEEAGKSLETRIKAEAKAIRDKYLEPPYTTDFGLLFLPIEGLYAEIIRRPGLVDLLQREYRVTLVSPTTLTAILNSLQMGFRTLAIEKRSGEVWRVLGAVKTEFGKFGEVLAKTKKKLDEARNTIDAAEVRTRAIDKQLRQVQALPAEETTLMFSEKDE